MDPHGEFSDLHLTFNLAYASKDYNTCDDILSQLQARVTQSRNLLRLEDNDNPVTGMSLENQNHVPNVDQQASLGLDFDVDDDFDDSVLGEAEKGFPPNPVPLADLDLNFDGFHGLDEELVVNPTVAKEPSHNDVSHQQPLAIPQDDLWDIDFSLGKEGTGDARNHHAVVDDQNQGMGDLVGSQHNKNDDIMALTGDQDTQGDESQEDDDEEMSQEDQEDDDEEMSQEDQEDDDEEMSQEDQEDDDEGDDQDGEEDMEIHQEAQEEDDQAVNLPTKRQIKPTPKLLHSLETGTSSEGSLKTSSSDDDEDWMP